MSPARAGSTQQSLTAEAALHTTGGELSRQETENAPVGVRAWAVALEASSEYCLFNIG